MNQLPEEEDFLEDEEDEDYESEDFGFVIRGDGSLKSIMIPEYLMDDPPIEVMKILKIFGIKNIHSVVERTIH